MADDRHQDADADDDLDQDQRDQRAAIIFVIVPKLLELRRVVLFHHDRPERGQQDRQDHQQAKRFASPVGQVVHNDGRDVGEEDHDREDAEGSVEGHRDHHRTDQAVPGVLVPYGI